MTQQAQTKAPPAEQTPGTDLDVRSIVREVRDGVRDGFRGDAQDPRAIREEVRTTIQDAIAAAQEAEAAQQGRPDAPAPPAPPPSLSNGGQEFRWGDNGLEIVTIDQQTGTETAVPFDAGNVIPPQVPEILFIGVMGLIGIILAFPIGRAIARYIDRRGTVPKVPDEVTHRLAAIEQAVDAVAIEMERMSEANRYTTRLLTERATAPDFAGAARQAAPEPHVRG